MSSVKEGSAREVVVERRWSWLRVTESEELVGRMSLVSRLPQYLDRSQCGVSDGFDRTDLMQAMLTGAEAVVWKCFDMVMVVVEGGNADFIPLRMLSHYNLHRFDVAVLPQSEISFLE